MLDVAISPDLQSCCTSHIATNQHAAPPSRLQTPGTLPCLQLEILAQPWYQLGLHILQVTEDGLNCKGDSLAYETEKDFRARWIQWLNMVSPTQVLSTSAPCLPQRHLQGANYVLFWASLCAPPLGRKGKSFSRNIQKRSSSLPLMQPGFHIHLGLETGLIVGSPHTDEQRPKTFICARRATRISSTYHPQAAWRKCKHQHKTQWLKERRDWIDAGQGTVVLGIASWTQYPTFLLLRQLI